MKNTNNKISHLLNQIRQLDNMLLMHNGNNDDMMVQQYQARKLDFLKELASELIGLSASSPQIFRTIKSIITKIESMTPVLDKQEISKQYKFSFTELETVLEGD